MGRSGPVSHQRVNGIKLYSGFTATKREAPKTKFKSRSGKRKLPRKRNKNKKSIGMRCIRTRIGY